MKVVKQGYEILDIPSKGIGILEVAGRTCYQSDDRIGCTTKGYIQDSTIRDRDTQCSWYAAKDDCSMTSCEHHSAYKFVKNLVKRGHHAMIEFGDIMVQFVTDRGVTHEFVRHRLCSFAQESTRYVKYDGGMEVILPVWLSEELLGEYAQDPSKAYIDIPANISNGDRIWLASMINAERDYKSLMALPDWKAQHARAVLPNSLKTEIVVKANIREWRHIFNLRCSEFAHPQINELLSPLLGELKHTLPVVFDDL